MKNKIICVRQCFQTKEFNKNNTMCKSCPLKKDCKKGKEMTYD